jgi:hypothetical protein
MIALNQLARSRSICLAESIVIFSSIASLVILPPRPILASENCPEGDRSFVTAETNNFLIYICGNNQPTNYLGIAKNGSGNISLPLSGFQSDRFTVKNNNITYILTPQYLTITQNGKTIQRDPIVSYNKNQSQVTSSSGNRSLSIPKVGVYNAGSRYITVAQNGNRFCYEGVSIPHRRYAVAVGETIGSLSPHKNGLIIDGSKRRSQPLFLSQGNNSLLVTFGAEEPQEYKFSHDLNPNEMSQELKQCLNSKRVVYMAIPGSGYKIR